MPSVSRKGKLCSSCKKAVANSSGYCTKCMKSRRRRSGELSTTGKRRREEQRELIASFRSRPCADCGIQYPSYVMEFDHARGTKSFNIGSGRYKSTGALLAELSKCDVVCANCHTIRTHFRRIGEA